MNIAFLPDLSALAILIFILAMVRRRHSDVRADAWLLGLFFTLVEAAAHTLYAPQGIPDRVLHVVVLDCYLLAGLVFNWAAGDQNVPRSARLAYLSLNGLALLTVTSLYGWNVRQPGIYVPAVVVGMIVGVVTSILVRHNARYAAGCTLRAGAPIGMLIAHQQHPSRLVYWSLACLYAIVSTSNGGWTGAAQASWQS